MEEKRFDCNEIIDNFLYLGSAQASKCLEKLKEIRITHIVNLAGKQHFEGQFEYLICHFEDDVSVSFLDKLESIFQFINTAAEKKGKVLVHCKGGVSRSVSIVVAYLMERQKLSLKEALILIKSKRPGTRPNDGFMFQLFTLETQIFGKNSLQENELTKITHLFRTKWKKELSSQEKKPFPLLEDR